MCFSTNDAIEVVYFGKCRKSKGKLLKIYKRFSLNEWILMKTKAGKWILSIFVKLFFCFSGVCCSQGFSRLLSGRNLLVNARGAQCNRWNKNRKWLIIHNGKFVYYIYPHLGLLYILYTRRGEWGAFSTPSITIQWTE